MTAMASNWWIHLLQAFWQATIAGAILLLLVRLIRGANPRLRHALVSLALLKFVLPPMLPLPTGIFSAAPPAREVWLDGSAAIALLMLVHLGGVAFMLARIAAGGWRVRRMVRNAAAADGFLLTDEVTVPITTGRHILIPRALHATLTAAELADMLEHEREHQRRGDVRTGVLQSLVAALWWFHPLVHVLVREARDLREERCDDAVVSRRGDRAAYARTLLRAAAFVSGETPQPAAAVAESEHGLLRRIRRLASARYVPSRRPGLAALIVLLLAALILLPGARRTAGIPSQQYLHHHGH
jgi:serine-type D-Ala-D-Ala endopeptidase (penicillin-binding protein 7)